MSFIIISQFILTNLFILVLLQQFAESDSSFKNSKSPLQEFHEYVDKFRAAWIECTEKYKGQKMNKSQLLRFFRILESPLGLFFIFFILKTYKFLNKTGFKDEENIETIAKFLMEMKIIGYVFLIKFRRIFLKFLWIFHEFFFIRFFFFIIFLKFL